MSDIPRAGAARKAKLGEVGLEAERRRVPEGRRTQRRGQRVVRPVQGFGKLWQKTYKVRLPARDRDAGRGDRRVEENFPAFWPKGNDFYRRSPASSQARSR